MPTTPQLAEVTLADKYRLERGRVFLTGMQALARLPMLQRERDRAAGLDTAGYVSGYRGSPLGGLDTALQEAAPFLAAHDVRFHPAVNEDLAATAIWGTQQLHLFPGPQRDGIFAMWYGKGPGVDRCGDVFKHANFAGTARHGGVLVVAGDDHSARSSAVAHQSEHVLSACAMPVLAPAGVQEYLDLGLHGWALSRYCGCWVALKTTSDSAESSAVVELAPERVTPRLPEDFALPPDGGQRGGQRPDKDDVAPRILRDGVEHADAGDEEEADVGRGADDPGEHRAVFLRPDFHDSCTPNALTLHVVMAASLQ